MSGPSMTDRVYAVPPERRGRVFSTLAALRQITHLKSDFENRRIPSKESLAMPYGDILEATRKARTPLLQAFALNTMTDDEFEAYVKKYVDKPQAPFQRAKQFLGGLVRKISPFKDGFSK